MNTHPNVVWPDESQLLNINFESKFVISRILFEKAMMGIMGTYGLSKSVHVTEITVDFKEKKMTLEAFDTIRSVREIMIEDFSSSEDKISFKCSTLYLNEILNNSKYSSFIQFDFLSSSKPIIIQLDSKSKVSSYKDIRYKKNDIEYKKAILVAPL
jgi:hypothetical protein